jgi:hypothetical protein
MRLLKQSAFLLALFLLTTPALSAGSFAAQSSSQPKKQQPAIPSPTGKASTAQSNVDSVQMVQRPTFDQGIYLPTYADGQSTCAAIMSYNFSSGDNPELKSVTTCTPARPQSVYRTDQKRKTRPPAVELQRISAPQRSGVN